MRNFVSEISLGNFSSRISSNHKHETQRKHKAATVNTNTINTNTQHTRTRRTKTIQNTTIKHINPKLDYFEGSKLDDDGEVEIVSMTCACPKCQTSGAIPVAHARKGGQRTETEQKTKHPMKKAMKKVTKGTLKLNNKKKKTKLIAIPRVLKKPASDKCIALPVQIVTRHKKGHEESYLMQNTFYEKYIAGQSKKQTSNYLENVAGLQKLIMDKSITTKAEAKDWLQNKLG